MKKFFTLIALALCAQASMAQDVVASLIFPDQDLAPAGNGVSTAVTEDPWTGGTQTGSIGLKKVGGYGSSGSANIYDQNGTYYHKLSGNDAAEQGISFGDGQVTEIENAKIVIPAEKAVHSLEYTLTEADIASDGSIYIYRQKGKSNFGIKSISIIGKGGGGEGGDPTPEVDNALLKEYFDYTENSALEGQGGWVVSTKASEATGSSPIVISRTITYSGYDGSATGKAVLFDDERQQTAEGNSRNSVVPFVSAKPATDDVFYAAFLGDFSNTATTSGKEIFSFIKQGAAAGDGTTARGRVWVKVTEDGNKSFAIRKNGQTIETYSAETPKTDAALLVVKYVNKSTGSSGTNDEFYLFVNPDPSKTEAENAAVKMDALGNDADGGADLRYVSFRQTKLNAAYAGLRVANTWEDAVKYNSGGATAISRVEARQKAANGEFFNLSGQRVAQPTKGLYIVNGKKVVVK